MNLKMKTIKKIVYILICIIIIAGIVVWKTNGFNLELQYSNRKQINISNNAGIEKSDIEQIASEVLGDTRYFIQEIETFGNSVSIVAEDITEEQKSSIIEKFNEKYETEIEDDDIEIVSIPFTRVKDIIKPYRLPGIITFVIILLYFLIRYRKNNWKSVLAKSVIIPVAVELLLYSIIAICRIQFGRICVAVGVALYAVVIYILANKFENERGLDVNENTN